MNEKTVLSYINKQTGVYKIRDYYVEAGEKQTREINMQTLAIGGRIGCGHGNTDEVCSNCELLKTEIPTTINGRPFILVEENGNQWFYHPDYFNNEQK